MPDRASRAAAQWAVQRPEMDMLPMEALGRLHEASIVVARERQAPLYARYGLQQGEFDALATLRRSGAPEGLTPTALFEAAMMSSGGMTARIDRLEKAGLVARGPHPTDRRATLVRLTDKGFGLIETIMPEHEEAARDILAPLSLDEQKTLNALLARLIGGLCD
ncbi:MULTISPECIES: MarR family winged helix-turn-helix transcriptional regulator [unclassified Brevundimonas]|uniref:MarR family winged helix-turn-helix transcriptional regulator n=1 Tax=unclassified Brevundimonas TaxID=2622653 RepID=UPI000CFC5753|nr:MULTISPECIES: MarR family transcriptional regulator [unclassified Brevundimonas]PRA34491.1 MarR family transcriptional regulator [Brevundimonas sp. MYb27]PQZ84192.1 MarR family transcriptional regulator [Brevundimonas sp. MYb31]PRB17835.1 MarR family transcriptional regulator [Brevundimonas sp. MYb52]PRB38206.1 MarR family transcriptional regulator [Brevundimonas sp. MYb46]PRB56013.1 MarR family transcriptional regulator [Brevundimonas sp. MYb33]